MTARVLRPARRAACAAVLLAPMVGLSSPVTRQDATTPLAPLTWLAGCWERRSGARVVEEQWMAPRGSVMLGMSRTVRNDTVVEYEHLRLEARPSAVVFVAQPSGQAMAEFPAIQVSDSLLIVENPAHDFPQRIIYRRRGADSLAARIEGTMQGRERGVDFPYARARCP